MKRTFLLSLLFFSSFLSSKSLLINSEHNVAEGSVETRPIQIECKKDCYLTTHLVSKKFSESSKWNSSAMYVLSDLAGNKGIRYGVKLNAKSNEPEVVVEYFDEEKQTQMHVLATSKIGDWEGFKLSWSEESFSVSLIRPKKFEGYSMLSDTGLNHNDKLFFVPEKLNYMFIGVNVVQYLDIADQNVNQKWLKIAEGN